MPFSYHKKEDEEEDRFLSPSGHCFLHMYTFVCVCHCASCSGTPLFYVPICYCSYSGTYFRLVISLLLTNVYLL